MEETKRSAEDHRRDRQRPLRVLVSASERQEIEQRAASACLSRSAYLRAAALSHPIRRLYDLAAVERLAAVGVEVRRLADVLTQVLAVPGTGKGKDVERLIAEIQALPQTLLELMSRV